MKNLEHQPDLSFIDDFITSTDLKEIKGLYADFLIEYFNSQEEDGMFLPEHRQKVLYIYKLVSALFDELHEMHVMRFGKN